jgi:tartrate dehydratase alpha subunit/fumarate hydratase class I-like protein
LAAQKAKTAAFAPVSKTEPAPKRYSLREELERNYDKLGE